MVPKLFLAIVFFLALPAWSQPNPQEKVGQKPGPVDCQQALDELASYKAEFSAELILLPGTPTQKVSGVIEGRRPDLMRLQVEMVSGEVQMTNLTVFDGEWQWVDTKQQRGQSVLRKVLKIDADTARPGAPFDTFYYYSGSGFLPGEDYLGTFQQLLRLYAYEPAEERDGRLVLEGRLIEQEYKKYLSDRDQLTLAEILEVDASMARCRLYVEPVSLLPTGYDMGEDLSNPQVRLRSRVTPSPDLPTSTFTYSPPPGWGVYDATAETVEARLSAQRIAPGSDFFEAVSAFLKRDDEMSEEMSSALDEGDGSKILALAKADPTQLSNKSFGGGTVLTESVELGRPELVARLLELGADVNQAGSGRNTPLHVAVRAGNREIAELLIKAGADPEARNSSSSTPLHLTAEPALIDLLLESGASENVYDSSGDLPPIAAERGAFLLQAVEEGEIQEIDKYLAQGLRPDQELKGPWGGLMTPLQVAALAGVPQLKHLLQRWEATGSTRRQTINELLDWAGSPEVVEFLLREGADLSKVTLLKERAPATTLALLNAGADPLETDEDGVTPLVFLLVRSQLYPEVQELAERLIKAGDSVDRLFVAPEQRDDLGKIGLIHLFANQPDRLGGILALGADVDLATEKGWTALHIATTFDMVESMELLHSKGGASLTLEEENGWTPLHSAAYLNQKDALAFLLSRQKDLNIQDKDGNTALHLAAHLNRSEIVQLLLEHGADPQIRNAEGEKAKI